MVQLPCGIYEGTIGASWNVCVAQIVCGQLKLKSCFLNDLCSAIHYVWSSENVFLNCHEKDVFRTSLATVPGQGMPDGQTGGQHCLGLFPWQRLNHKSLVLCRGSVGDKVPLAVWHAQPCFLKSIYSSANFNLHVWKNNSWFFIHISSPGSKWLCKRIPQNETKYSVCIDVQIVWMSLETFSIMNCPSGN